ncbi:DsbA family oxidoreductase [Solimicrobium silvestre]|uniref:Putative dithiol-disulfide isomerase involved in polyketide biosynthesis n=1 Tax=Solimicrobium silvestre TaxID=2099400 RepID=A0A2S9H311_9BURK|nr:DsbA family oxidoreductase [Solimicrobium silvestre]PRC94323.1 putative dithiol-disulfide isomerase involved in polyketide biosynthesis [Solimicrobium silvestre]
MRIDIVSDVACPWCAVGLNSLERALEKIGDDIPVQLHFQPFELNPTMDFAGVDSAEYLLKKYGMSKEQLAQNRLNLHQRGAEVGFQFGTGNRVWNTFHAHRLMHWAGLQNIPDVQRKLKHALLQAYHGEGLNTADPETLVTVAVKAGLNEAQAREVVNSDLYSDEVREAEKYWQQAGISSVPAFIINQKHLISGGQPPNVFVEALRKIAEEE